MTIERRDGNHMSGFREWIRGNRKLDSNEQSLSIQDGDLYVHQFIRPPRRADGLPRQNTMCVEEKSFGASQSRAQADTFMVLGQLHMDHWDGTTTREVNTLFRGKVEATWWGYHLLIFSGKGPLDSETIMWDGKIVTLEQLEQILTFRIHPNTLEKLD